MSAFPQQAVQKVKQYVEPSNTAAFLATKFQQQMFASELATMPVKTTLSQGKPEYGPEMEPSVAGRSASSITVAASWKPFTASMNIYGMIVSNSKPLIYNDNLHAVSFIHRKGPLYSPIPMPFDARAQAGAIVGMVTDNWGTEWDTTLIWNHEDWWARYPQGGMYNIPGSKCLRDSAYIIATGPITNINTTIAWAGSYFASKQLDSLGGARNNDTVSPGLSDHLFVANNGSFPIGKVDFPRLDFSVTDDGIVRSMGILVNNINPTSNPGAGPYGWKGASVVTGTFISGSFAWQVDTLQPDIYLSPAGNQYALGTPHMAWNESGTVGYVWFIGVRNPRNANDSGSNMGYQPIIFKTTNSGATWNEMPKINFNDTTSRFSALWETMIAVDNESYGMPFFFDGEGMDGIVDRNDRLHIVTTIISHAIKHPDSLGYTWSRHTHKDGEVYRFRHSPGNHPFIFDFTETNEGWRVTLIDSMSTEGPAAAQTGNGYDYNPWDADPNNSNAKVNVDARLQLSRTPDGRYIVYTWAESDTGLTFQNFKWNSSPNVKARLAEIGPETGTVTPATIVVHPMEINVTNPVSILVPPYTKTTTVSGRAMMHYVSPKCAVISSSLASGVAIGLPITVSNSSPYKQLLANTHWYLSANLNFGEVSSVDWPHNECSLAPKDTTTEDTTGIGEIAAKINRSVLYPNPAGNSAQLSIGLDHGSEVNITVLNTIGQVVSTLRHKGTAGENTINLDLSNLSAGVYMVNIKIGDATGNKRLLIQH